MSSSSPRFISELPALSACILKPTVAAASYKCNLVTGLVVPIPTFPPLAIVNLVFTFKEVALCVILKLSSEALLPILQGLSPSSKKTIAESLPARDV